MPDGHAAIAWQAKPPKLAGSKPGAPSVISIRLAILAAAAALVAAIPASAQQLPRLLPAPAEMQPSRAISRSPDDAGGGADRRCRRAQRPPIGWSNCSSFRAA
jgi:hypothetical protein